MYWLSLRRDCTVGSLQCSYLMSELLVPTIKRVKYVLTHYRRVKKLLNGVVQDEVQEN